MNWLTPAYSIIAAACVTLACVNGLVWVKQPERRGHLAFFLTAISVAAITPFEWMMARAETPAQFGTALRWTQVPVCLAVVSLVWFIWVYFGTGRRWLALAACGARVSAMILGFVFSPNLNFREITELRRVSLLGGESASVPIGIVNPWTLIGQLASVLFLVYVVDASIKLWRRGDHDARRRAWLLGGAAAFFVLVASGIAAMILAGLIVSPVILSLPFLPVVLAMGYELSLDVVRAGNLSKAVKANEERLALAQEAGDIGTYDWDIQTGRVIWSENLEAIYGVRLGAFGGTFENWKERVHPDDLSKCESELAEAIRLKRLSWQSEYRMFRADTNEMRWIEAKGRFAFNAKGEPVRMVGVNMDTTGSKQAEAALRDSELRLSGLVSSAMDAIISIDETQAIVLFNSAAEKLFGYPAAEMMGQSIDCLVPESFREVHRQHVRTFAELNITNRSLGRFDPIYGRKADGSEFPIEASISQLEMKGQRYYTVIIRDITERKRGEEALRASEARFRNMADTAPVLIWISGADKLCSYFNQGWLDFSGRTIEQELGNGWTEGIHNDDLAHCLDVFDSAFDRRVPFKMEYRLRRADGEYRWIYDCGTPRFSANGEFLGYIGSCIDIGDRKEAEDALQTANEELKGLKNQLQAENIILQEEIKQAHRVSQIIGDSNKLKYVLFKVEQVAQTDSSVLILGETGTGKELVARAIHEQSKRRDRPLIRLNCAALSATLIESELFGHEKGAFTGAWSRKIGRFELANGATLFLDEIAELPLELQSKLLRVIQEGEFERLGSSRTIKVDVRIIAATNRNMKLAVEQGRFREDLWYRLNVFPITLPPLRERKEDIPVLVEHFVQRISASVGKTITSISSPSLKKLHDYYWPGNVRELGNVIERAVINSRGSTLHIDDRFEPVDREEESLTSKTLAELEREYIARILDQTSGRIGGPQGAAKILGLHPNTLRTRMAKLGIQKDIKISAGNNGESH